jgi:hypothetical protein
MFLTRTVSQRTALVTESRALIRGLMSDVIRKCCHVTSKYTGRINVGNNEDNVREIFLWFVVLWLFSNLVLTPSTYVAVSPSQLPTSEQQNPRNIMIHFQWLQELRKSGNPNIK